MSSVSNSSQATNNFDVAENVFNQNSTTYFSSKGVGAFIEVAEKENKDYSALELSLYRGSDRRTKFELEYLNKDGEFEGTVPHLFVSSGLTEAAETYQFEKVTTSKFKITFKGNIDNNQFVDPHDLEDVKLKPEFLQTLDHAYKNHQRDTSGDVGPNKQFLSIRSIKFYQAAEGKQQDKIDVDEHYEKIAKLFPLKFNKHSSAFYLSTESEKPKVKKKETPKKKDTKQEEDKERSDSVIDYHVTTTSSDNKEDKKDQQENNEKNDKRGVEHLDFKLDYERPAAEEPSPKKKDKDFYGELGNSHVVGTGGLESLDKNEKKKK